ncbi:hypothetical protein SPRG_02217 [Saprolegnia parasitica CBS 223.65]|uniref:Uncharacterized protein n=1 Tax=Saprolegnia parasitica (strain CBS 223.65) TaxID=695850 RepID=A0A067CVW9_SAPPC|nr:hypothetical protein SPRG_02217 [Saprolegnia parasitica CBS 223.65]KDO33410.1 hypothetical protein SPRG_02217 [Saprolegnia parasitica CBS 223.65]|eukprot:XP_012196158.1 hypothetical protein SPRG_02217 [Saprolegnia parasitica CBS 223.65]
MGINLKKIFRHDDDEQKPKAKLFGRKKALSVPMDHDETASESESSPRVPHKSNSFSDSSDDDIETKLRLFKELLIQHDILLNTLMKKHHPVVEIPDCYKETRATSALVSGKMIPITMHMVRNKRRPRWNEYPLRPITESKKEE